MFSYMGVAEVMVSLHSSGNPNEDTNLNQNPSSKAAMKEKKVEYRRSWEHNDPKPNTLLQPLSYSGKSGLMIISFASQINN